MRNRLTSTMQQYAASINSNSATIAVFARRSLVHFYTTAHHALMVSGIAALCTLAVMFYRPDWAQQIKQAAHLRDQPPAAAMLDVSAKSAPLDVPAKGFDKQALNAPAMTESVLAFGSADKTTGGDRQQRSVTNWLSKRYRVANDATDMLVSAAYATSKDTKIDPLLILAVVAIESGFNPFAESAVGAQGLMQVMSKIHHEKFQYLGGVKAALNPVANIRVGSMILKDYVTRGGSVEAGLKMYVGAAAFDNDAGYGSKVLAEYRRLKDVAAGKTVPLFSAPSSAVIVRNQTKSNDTGVTVPKDDGNSGDKTVAPEAVSDQAAADHFVIM